MRTDSLGPCGSIMTIYPHAQKCRFSATLSERALPGKPMPYGMAPPVNVAARVPPFVAGTEVNQRVVRRDNFINVQLHADENVKYGRVAQVMAAINRAGIVKLGFITIAQ